MSRNKFSYSFIWVFGFIFILSTFLGGDKIVLGEEKNELKNDGTVEITSATFESNNVAKGIKNTLRIDYKILNKDKLKEGDKISISLPEVFKEISPKYPEQHFKDVDLKDGVLTLTFNKDVDKAVKGYMIISFVGDEKIKKDEPYSVTIDLIGKRKTFYVQGQERGEPSEGGKYPIMYKTADLPLAATDTKDGREYYGEIEDRNKPIKYFVEINLGDGEHPNTRSYLRNATFADKIPKGMALDVYSLKISKHPYDDTDYAVDVTEDFINASRVKESLDYLEIDFGDIPYDRYTISYETRITSTEKGYSNEAKLNYDDTEVPAKHYSKLSKEAGALNVYKEVDKSEVSNNPKDQNIKYTIKFDSYGHFFKDTLTIKDTLDKDLEDIKIKTTNQFEASFNKETKELIVKNTKGDIDNKSPAYITIEASMRRVKPGKSVENIAYVNGNPTNKVSTKKRGMVRLVLDSAYIDEEEFYKGEVFKITTEDGKSVKNFNDEEINFIKFNKGKSNLIELPVGSYRVSQIVFPRGHEKKKNPIKFKVKDSYKNTNVKVPVSKKRSSANLIINKVNGRGKPLLGAEFEIFKKEDENTPLVFTKDNSLNIYKLCDFGVSNLSSLNNSNSIQIENLPYGEYILREVKSPRGHKSCKDIYLYISYEKSFFKVGQDGGCISLEEKEDEGGYEISVKNERGLVLPNSGGCGTHQFSFIGITLLAGALSLLSKEFCLKERMS